MLWTAQRCMSSCFERAVRELQDVKVIFEPYTFPFNFGPERRADSYISLEVEKKYATYTYDSVDEKLLSNYGNFSAIFSKSMAYQVPIKKYEVYTQGKLSVFKHTFLIRNPRLSIPSLWRVHKKIGMEFPGVQGVAFQKMYKFFEYIRSKTDQEVVVVDANDLLRDPGATLLQYCQKTGLNYSEGMLTWKPGIVEDWTEYPFYIEEWFGGAMFSSGFNRGLKNPEKVEEGIPPEVEEQIEKAMPYYESMHKHCIEVP